MDDQLMLGVLLIIVGIAVGLIAVAVVLNRREDRIAADMDLETEDTEDEKTPEPEEKEPPNLELDEDEPPEGADETARAEGDELPTPRERHLVAEIYREEVTGKLIVRAGDQEYLDSKEIESEAERRRLAYAASDLSDWFQGEYELGGRSVTALSAQQSASPNQMLEEINGILQRALAGSPDRGVRLIPDAASGVRVLIGVKSYEIEEVPDKEIKGLIRQAVSEWEADQ